MEVAKQHMLLKLTIVFISQLTATEALRNCEEWRLAGYPFDGSYWIDPDGLGGEERFLAFCQISTGKTIISNDIPTNGILLTGQDALYESPGEYIETVTYAGPASLPQLKSLIDTSEECVQFVSFSCLGVNIWNEDGEQQAWWVSRDGEKVLSWGGLPSGFQGCECALGESGSNTCSGGGRCNCDSDSPGVNFDQGYINDMTKLPVKEVRIGGITSEEDRVRIKIGSLRCSGLADMSLLFPTIDFIKNHWI